ncbi:MAG: hypothetical protein LBR51_05555 [Bacteroidales bacterium]|jgi:predicted GH43/DUF377 family glycosyl hydrolase|nr:hypothetical protein [Bacteroidales bacterium]
MRQKKNRFALFAFMCLYFLVNKEMTFAQDTVDYFITNEQIKVWGNKYRGWHYYPGAIIPDKYAIPGFEDFHSFDVPCVYQLPDDSSRWYMSFIGFNGKGYHSFVVESRDLLHWEKPRLAMGFGPTGEFDHGGSVIGGFLYENWKVNDKRVLKKQDGKYWTLYGCYPRQGDYELRPGYEGVAYSEDGIVWKRALQEPILSIFQKDVKEWEKDCIYQPWLVEHEGTYYNFYNAAHGIIEQSGLAFSNNLLHWVRYPYNPVMSNHPGGYDDWFASDPKVYQDGDHWIMIYFGVGNGGASIMIAFSRDLLHWYHDPEPLYKFGGHPSGLDQQYAHKISLIYNPKNNTSYLFYCAVGNEGRTIGLLTSKVL